MEKAPEKIDPTSPKATAGQEKIEHLAEMPEKWQALREEVLEKIENKIDGLDIERVCEFLWSQNLPVSEFRFFDEEDIPKLQKIFGKILDVRNDLAGGHAGTYLSGLDLILIPRDRVLGSVNGSVFEEGLLIHEQAHAANLYEQYAKTNTMQYRPRQGFDLNNVHFRKYNEAGELETSKERIPWGNFLEEGFADMKRGDYIKQNISATMREKVHQRNKGTDWKTFSGSTYEVSDKYVFLLSSGEALGCASSAIAATGLEMLFKKQPKLMNVMFEARSDIKQLREIPKLINAIKPGLYFEIQKCGTSQDEFIRVQNIIKEAIENSK